MTPVKYKKTLPVVAEPDVPGCGTGFSGLTFLSPMPVIEHSDKEGLAYAQPTRRDNDR